MVSRKCTIQLSLAFMFPMDAAAPPSAMTVCALPNRDLEMIAVRLPASRASIAARRPAPPAPITTTSYGCLAMSVMSVTSSVEEPQVGEPVGGHGHHVEIRDGKRRERRPREAHVV